MMQASFMYIVDDLTLRLEIPSREKVKNLVIQWYHPFPQGKVFQAESSFEVYLHVDDIAMPLSFEIDIMFSP
jgi:hypothetical protein